MKSIQYLVASIKKYIENYQGFTLVELLIYMGLLGIFLLVLTEMFVSILDVRVDSQATSAVEQDGRYLLARLAYDVNRASSISTPATAGNSGNSLVLVIGGVNYSYSLNSGNLQLTSNQGTNNLNSSETTISSSTFQRLGNGNKDSIRLQITIDSRAQRKKGVETKIFQTTLGLR